MIARALGALVLVASVGLGTPWNSPAPAAIEPVSPAPAAPISADPQARLEAAVENATHRHVPGTQGSDWVLHRIERSEPGIGGVEFIVATGVVTTAGAPDTRVRLSGRYDPATGEIARVSYKLQAAETVPSSATPALGETPWTIEQGVQDAFAQVLPDAPVRFALQSAQSSRVEGGGRRFEGDGIGTFGTDDARFVAFTMTLSARGELVEFDYGMPGDDTTGPDYLARY